MRHRNRLFKNMFSVVDCTTLYNSKYLYLNLLLHPRRLWWLVCTVYLDQLEFQSPTFHLWLIGIRQFAPPYTTAWRNRMQMETLPKYSRTHQRIWNFVFCLQPSCLYPHTSPPICYLLVDPCICNKTLFSIFDMCRSIAERKRTTLDYAYKCVRLCKARRSSSIPSACHLQRQDRDRSAFRWSRPLFQGL